MEAPIHSPTQNMASGIPQHLRAAFVLTAWTWSQPRCVRRASPPQPHHSAGSLHSCRVGHTALDCPSLIALICSHTLSTRQGLKPAALAVFGCQKTQILSLHAGGLLLSSPFPSPSFEQLLLLEARLESDQEDSLFLIP